MLRLGSFAADVRSAVLTGLSTATGGAISASDTLLAALGKLQAQVSALGSGGGGAPTYQTASVGQSFLTRIDGISGTVAASTDMFTVPTGVIFIPVQGGVILTSVAGTSTNNVLYQFPNKQTGALVSTGSSVNYASVTTGRVHANNALASASIWAVAGNTVQFQISGVSNASSVTLTGFIVGFYLPA